MINLNEPKILAVIPAYNESQHISEVIRGVQPYLPALVVDDGSTDNTSQVAQEAGALVICQTPNQGKGAALRTGFRYALQHDYQAVVMLDADGQHDSREIPLFIQAYLDQQADLVIGAREYRQIPPFRRMTNTVGRWSFSWAMGQYIPDNQSGYRLLSRRMIEAMLLSTENRWEFEVEMIVTCIHSGYRLEWVPIRTIYGDQKSHIQPLRHLFHFYRMVFLARKASRLARSKHHE